MGMGTDKGPPGRTTLSDINVTPMVDVVLVLLIIFMVTAPLIQQGVKVNLPQTRAAPVEATEKKVVLSVDRSKRVFLGEAEVPLKDLEQILKANAKVQLDKEIYLHADRDLAYGVVVDVIAAARRAGIKDVGLITDPLMNARKNP